MDPTEQVRRRMLVEINTLPSERELLEKDHGQVWDTDELSKDFEVLGFLAPFVHVRRKSDQCEGSIMFQHSPRLYFGFKPK